MGSYGNREPLFKNRQLSGKALSLVLKQEFEDLNPVVAGRSGGGVEVAYYVAKELQAEFTVLVSNKLPLPANPEYGLGAITEDLSVCIPPAAEKMLDEITIKKIIDEQKLEAHRLMLKSRKGNMLPDFTGRLVILIDEGIVPGMNLVPVIRLRRRKGASKVMVAAPMAGKDYGKTLEKADDIKIVVQSDNFLTKAQAYEQSAEPEK